jgi:CBS domain-containing protein
MSARAAWRLETLGFDQMYRYQPGKSDWLAAGLPREGKRAAVPRIADAADPNPPICALQDSVAEVRRLLSETGADLCVVLNERRVVLGVVRERDLVAKPDLPVDDLLDPGPVTYRPHTPLAEVVKRMQESQGRLNRVLVTTSDAELIGLLGRAEAEQFLEAAQQDRQVRTE